MRANGGETETERETLTARQTDRLISSGGEIERDRQTDRRMNRDAERDTHKYRQTDK